MCVCACVCVCVCIYIYIYIYILKHSIFDVSYGSKNKEKIFPYTAAVYVFHRL